MPLIFRGGYRALEASIRGITVKRGSRHGGRRYPTTESTRQCRSGMGLVAAAAQTRRKHWHLRSRAMKKTVAVVDPNEAIRELWDMKKRVVIVDPYEAVRELLCRYLENSTAYEVVGEAATELEAMRVLKRTPTNVAIIDPALPGLCGPEVISRLRREIPELRIVVFTGAADKNVLPSVLRSNPDGIVHKSEPLEILLSALRTASVGGRFFSPKTNHFVSNSTLPPTQPLSTREIEVLQSIAEGKSNKEIGHLLGVATKTVDNHRTRLMQKLGLHNAASLTLAAVQMGIVQAPSVAMIDGTIRLHASPGVSNALWRSP
jgi:DNA-binding NarL/FixJ family response regulator